MNANAGGDARAPTEALFRVNESVYGSALQVGHAYQVITVNHQTSRSETSAAVSDGIPLIALTRFLPRPWLVSRLMTRSWTRTTTAWK